MTREQAYQELCFYTLAHDDPAFVHQHVVDAYAAQSADVHAKPIKLAFALIGLYLHLECGFTGKEVQHAHMRLAAQRKDWPTFPLPQDRGTLSAIDVLAHPPGIARDAAIEAWCACVWHIYRHSHTAVAALLQEQGMIMQ